MFPASLLVFLLCPAPCNGTSRLSNLLRLESGSWQAPNVGPKKSFSGRCCLVWASEKISSRICVTSSVWSGDLVAKGGFFRFVCQALSEFPNRMHLREGCDVLKIDFAFRSDLDGALSPALCEFPKLGSLDLIFTKVSGDLATLAECHGLTMIDLSRTNVAGDLKALGNAVELRTLRLPDTKVEGNIAALRELTELRDLDLSNTQVEGNIEALHELTKLEKLHLENTNVSGYMASLREAKDLKDVKISGTRIAGARCLSAWGLLPKLCDLYVAACSLSLSGQQHVVI